MGGESALTKSKIWRSPFPPFNYLNKMFKPNISLKDISHYKIGGKAKYFFEAKNIDEIKQSVTRARDINERIFILGSGTNILINDDGFDGLIIKPDLKIIEFNDYSVRAGAGVLVDDLVNSLIEKSFSGLEWAAGLPGTVGGAVRGNAGAFGGEIKEAVSKVVSLDISAGSLKIVERSVAECAFNYRSSIFKNQSFGKPKEREIILEVIFNIKKGNLSEIREIAEKNINYRRDKHPLEYPSLGSSFKNISLSSIGNNKKLNGDILKTFPIKHDPFPVIPVAYLISECGLKGVSCGGAMISPKHPNFIVNTLDATAKDVINLIELAKNEVRRKFNFELEEEIEYL